VFCKTSIQCVNVIHTDSQTLCLFKAKQTNFPSFLSANISNSKGNVRVDLKGQYRFVRLCGSGPIQAALNTMELHRTWAQWAVQQFWTWGYLIKWLETNTRAPSMILKLYFNYILQNCFGPVQDLCSLTMPGVLAFTNKGPTIYVHVCWAMLTFFCSKFICFLRSRILRASVARNVVTVLF